ncbi:MAG: pyridoxamine 5'-phosphate oxidase family protein [Tepidiformaceae bacterium]
MAIEFTDEMVAALDNSFKDQKIVMIASAGKSGMPDLAFKGSAFAWDREHIAFWERALGTTFRNLQENPQACLLYRNPEARMTWKFFGEATVYTEGETRDAVMARSVQEELDRDPERKGAAVIVRVDKIVFGPNVLQER